MKCNVSDYLEETAAKYPEKIGFADKDREISFCDFRKGVRRTAWAIIRKGLFRRPIVIYLDKTIDHIQTMYGVAYSGCPYTPVDIHMPSARVEKIMETLEPGLIITDRAHAEGIRTVAGNTPLLMLEEIEKETTDEEAVEGRRAQIIDTDLLYVFFTSGSTGIPKGVMIPHRAVLDFTDAMIERFDITDKERIGNQTPFYFDLSTMDIYCTAACGATMFVIPPDYFKFPVKLMQYVADNQINMIYWVPSALVLTANLRALQAVDARCLKKITFCGEVMPCKQLNIWRKHIPDALYANLYGPTETTSASTYYIVDREFEDNDSLPIGVPFRNTRIVLLKEDGSVAGKEEMGEICIAGSSLAHGYYRNEEKTAESFVTVSNGAYKETFYRTGDLAKYNERGELMYLSRKDFQIKHMGHRIELGEIETAINSLSQITECCCLYDEENHKIVAWLEKGVEEKQVEASLKQMIPEYMMPNKYYFLDRMPHNANGKIDRAKLKEMLKK